MSALGVAALVLLSVVRCDGPEATDWVRSFRDRVLAYDGLAAFAVSEFGAPVACDGSVSMEFDGVSYGTLRLAFASGVSLEVETQPIETSIMTLRREGGFDDAAAVEAALRAYTEAVGVAIDWDASEASTDAGESVTTFRDPDDGLNASAEVRSSGGRLVAVRFSMAP